MDKEEIGVWRLETADRSSRCWPILMALASTPAHRVQELGGRTIKSMTGSGSELQGKTISLSREEPLGLWR